MFGVLLLVVMDGHMEHFPLDPYSHYTYHYIVDRQRNRGIYRPQNLEGRGLYRPERSEGDTSGPRGSMVGSSLDFVVYLF